MPPLQHMPLVEECNTQLASILTNNAVSNPTLVLIPKPRPLAITMATRRISTLYALRPGSIRKHCTSPPV